MSKRVWVLLTGAGLWMLFIVACLAFKFTEPALNHSGGQLAVFAAPHAPPAADLPDLVITETVGTDSAQCGAKSSLVVAPETDIYFCLTVFNSGNTTFTSAKIKQENS